jgi:hypothetical protein
MIERAMTCVAIAVCLGGCAAAAGDAGPSAGAAAGSSGAGAAGGSTPSSGSGGTESAGAGGSAGTPDTPDPGDAGSAASADCDLLEDFEQTEWPHLPWTPMGGGGKAVGTLAAHDGSQGLMASEWQLNQFVQVGLPGDRLRAWVRGAAGRVYLGFGSTPHGTKALAFAPNADSLILNDVPTFYEFADVDKMFVGPSTTAWYRMEIEFGTGGQVTGRLFASDGKTEVAQVSHTFADLVPVGIAVRAFNDTYMDSIELCRE